MNNNSRVIWLGVILLFLLPTPMGRVLIDMAGGIFIFIILISLLFSGFIWLSFRSLKSNINTCNSCGASYFSNLPQCPVCGSTEQLDSQSIDNNVPASSATIDVNAEKAD